MALGVQILPPPPTPQWLIALKALIDAAARVGGAFIERGQERKQSANELLLGNMSGKYPDELLGTEAGQALVQNLGIANRPELQDLLARSREAATIRYPEKQITTPSGGLAGQLGGPIPAATPMLSGGPDTGPAMSIPPGRRTMTIPEAQVAVGQREFGIKMGQKEYENAMELKKYDAEKAINLYYEELGRPRPVDVVRWTRETMDNAKAAGLNIEGISHEGLSVAGAFKQQGRSLEEQRLYDQQWKDYQDSVQKAMSFKFSGAKYLADLRTGKPTAFDSLFSFAAPGTDTESMAGGQYYSDPKKRYGFMFHSINKGVEDWNKILTDTARQYRFRPTRFDPIPDSLTGHISDAEDATGKPFSDLVDSLGIGGLFKKAKDAFTRFGQATQYQEGQTAANPKTGQRLRFTNGQWIPTDAVQKDAEYAAFRAKHPNEPEDLVKLLWQRWLESRRQ